MANINHIKKGLKDAGDIAQGLAALGVVVTLVEPVAKSVKKALDDSAEDRKDMVEIPRLYSKNLSVNVERAKILLEELALKVEIVEIQKPQSKYKDCFDLQVVGTHPRRSRKVKPGTLVYVKYVTKEIINKSKNIFEESEKRKTEMKQRLLAKRQLVLDKTKRKGETKS